MIDNHAHPFDRSAQPFDLNRLAIDLAERDGGHPENRLPALWRAVVASRVAARLGATGKDLHAARAEAARDYPVYVRSLFADAGIDTLIMDPSWPPGADLYRREFESLSGCSVHLVLRLEPVIDDLLMQQPGYDDLLMRFDRSLLDAVETGYVGLKSAIAYRTGLAVEPDVSEQAARASLQEPAPLRRRAKLLRDQLLQRALAFAAEHRLPVQIHTGFGDSDLRLAESNPLLLEDLLRTPAGSAAPIVLLHAGFPYEDAAGYLAAAHANVHVDISLVNVFAPADLTGTLLRVTQLAPPDRILLGTDAYSLPEVFWVAATILREAWERLQDRHRELGVGSDWLEAVRQAAFEDNARHIYRLAA